jgi:hypothetical protein
MVAADATPPGSARRSAGLPPSENGAFGIRPGARYVGTYHCQQGWTELTFVFDALRGTADEGLVLDVTFDFRFDGRGGPSVATEGSAHMKGTLDPATGTLRLHAEDWIEQPPNYQLVDFVGVLQGGTYSGSVEGPGCTSFTARRDRSDDAP